MTFARFGLVLVVAALVVTGVRADDDWKHVHGTIDDVQLVTADTGYLIVDVPSSKSSDNDEVFVITEDTKIEIVLVNKDGKVVARNPGDVDDLYKGEHVRIKYNSANYHVIRIGIVVHV